MSMGYRQSSGGCNAQHLSKMTLCVNDAPLADDVDMGDRQRIVHHTHEAHWNGLCNTMPEGGLSGHHIDDITHVACGLCPPLTWKQASKSRQHTHEVHL